MVLAVHGAELQKQLLGVAAGALANTEAQAVQKCLVLWLFCHILAVKGS